MERKLILMYHDVYEKMKEESGFLNIGALSYKIQREVFEKHIIEISKASQGNRIRVTFDDGGISFTTIIAPILNKYNMKGIFFISTYFIGSKGFLSKQEIQELHKMGHIVGVHSHTHPKDISKAAFNEIKYEWAKSVNILSEIVGQEIIYASIPNGIYSKESLIVLQELGVKNIFTSVPTTKIKTYCNGTKVYGRFAVKEGMQEEKLLNLLNFKYSNLLSCYIKWGILKNAQRLFGGIYFIIRNAILSYKYKKVIQ